MRELEEKKKQEELTRQAEVPHDTIRRKAIVTPTEKASQQTESMPPILPKYTTKTIIQCERTRREAGRASRGDGIRRLRSLPAFQRSRSNAKKYQMG